jgi:predicted metalloprotease with PDZ domain
VHVVILVPEAIAGPAALVIPRAIPSGYAEQPYDRFVERVQASGPGGTPLKVERTDGPRWTLGGPDTRVARVDYDVDVSAMERQILSAADASKARDDYLGLLGYSIFGYLDGLEGRAVDLSVIGPNSWPIVTTLAPSSPPPRTRASARAPDFYALADSQIVMGPSAHVRRIEAAVPLFLVVHAEGPVDLDLEADLSRRALDHTIEYFGAAPFPHYTVHLELLRPISERHEYGFSMEHLESGTFYLAADRGLTASSPQDERDRTRFNFLHHMAHAWVPKRAYGEGYLPFTWELAPLIDTLWVNEGFARYAAIDMMADSLPSDAGPAYRRRALDGLSRLLDEMPPFIRRMSLVDLSRVASTRYSEDFRTGRSVFARGALMAAEMDDRIRDKSGARKRFRDALRGLVAWSAKHRRAFRVDELPAILAEATGVDVRDIQQRWLAPMPTASVKPAQAKHRIPHGM